MRGTDSTPRCDTSTLLFLTVELLLVRVHRGEADPGENSDGVGAPKSLTPVVERAGVAATIRAPPSASWSVDRAADAGSTAACPPLTTRDRDATVTAAR